MYIPVVPQETTVPVNTPAPWSRNSEWVALPTVTAGDQKFVGLYAVWNTDSNFVALTVAGRYTVDWGDGTPTEDIASGVSAEHNYVFTALASSTLTSEGFRQAIITVTMRLGDSFTSLNLQDIHSQAGLVSGLSTCWLDIRHDGASMTTLTVGGTSPVRHSMLEQYEFVGSSSLTSATSEFSTCRKLGSVVGTSWTSGCNTFTSMFQSCSSLQTIPLLNTAAGNTFTSMFNGCTSLQTIPSLVTTSGTTMTTMFSSCSSLKVGAMTGTKATISYASCELSGTELDAIYTALGDGTGQTITVTPNWGTATDTPGIATAKNWTVV